MILIRQLSDLLLNPFFLLLFFLCLSTYFLWRGKHLNSVKWVNLFVCVLFVLVSTGWFPHFLNEYLESRYTAVKSVNPHVPWVVVLGGGKNYEEARSANDALSNSSIKRLLEGVRLINKLPKAQIVFCGGDAQDNESEASLMSQVAQSFSVSKSKIILESKSINTADQARALVSIVHKEPFYLVTSATHMPRAMDLCLAQGLHPIAAPTDFTYFWSGDQNKNTLIPNGHNLHYLSISMHEYLGMLWARVCKRFGHDVM